jgi:hypothetical protein
MSFKAMIQNWIAMVSKRRVERAVPSVGARIEVVKMALWLLMVDYSRQLGQKCGTYELL